MMWESCKCCDSQQPKLTWNKGNFVLSMNLSRASKIGDVFYYHTWAIINYSLGLLSISFWILFRGNNKFKYLSDIHI